MSWRHPKTAPRDGTIIVGLFERRGKRAIARRAAFDTEEYRLLLVDPAPPNAPQWIKDGEDQALENYRNDPSFGFAPEGDDDEQLGRMIGWRPYAK